MGEFNIYKVYSKKTGEQLADFDPIKFGEEGLAKAIPEISFGKAGDLKFLSPEIRLTSKVIQSTRPLATGKRSKVALDIAQLSGEKDLAVSPTLLRGYGVSKKQQKELFLDGEFYATHGGKDILPRFFDEVLIGGEKAGSPDIFFSTPSPVEKGIAYARLSRMGIGVDKSQATIRDLLKGEKISFFGSRKQVIIEKGKLGKDFIQPNIQTSEIEIGRVLPKEGTKLKIKKQFKTIIEGEPVKIAFAEGIDISKLSKKDLADISKITKIKRKKSSKEISLSPTIRFDSETKVRKRIQKQKSILDINRLQKRTQSFVRADNKITRTDITPTRKRSNGRTRRNIPEIRLDVPIRKRDDPIRLKTSTRRITPTTRRIDTPTRIITHQRITSLESKIVRPKIDFKQKRQKPLLKEVGTYSVQVRRGGEFRGIGTDLTLGQAIRLGKRRTKSTLARTFKIIKTGRKKKVKADEIGFSEVDKKMFRGYKINKGKKIDLGSKIFIQKAPFALGSKGETKELQKFRREQKQLNKLINF